MSTYVFGDDRKSAPVLTKYERAALIGNRAAQINNGVKPLVSFDPTKEKWNPIIIAERELRAKKLPMLIERKMPNNVIEVWGCEELTLIN